MVGSAEHAVAGSMYLVLPVPFRVQDGALFVEAQAANGLDRWADNFAQVTVAAPVVPESLVGTLAGVRWVPVAGLEQYARIRCQPLPWAYSPREYFKVRAATVAAMREEIARADHLQFAIGGLVGDWAANAALEAKKMGRKYAVHTDRVEHEVVRRTLAGDAGWVRRLRVAVEAPLMERLHRQVIEGATLGLWHGEECFRAYSPWCGENHLIHDVHTKASDYISAAELEKKVADVVAAPVLRICYAGRLDPMKAPLEWLRAVAAAGVGIEATWFGEGAMLEEAQAECARLGLKGGVRFAGFVADRGELLGEIRQAHVLMFTHVTPESPRNLLEALVCGTPIVGYRNGYAAELLDGRGGGELVELHDFAGLGSLVAGLARDRGKVVEMVRAAAVNGRRFSDAAVFQERSELVKQFG